MDNPYQAIIALLQDKGVPFKQLEHEPVFTSQQAAAVRGLTLEQGAKSLLFKTKQGFVLVVLPGDKRVDSKRLKKLLDVSDVRFASPEEVKTQMGCEIGACYPFGLVAGLRTIVDASLSNQDTISFNPGRHDRSIKIAFSDYVRLANPEIASISSE